jgi:hypothetical protein
MKHVADMGGDEDEREKTALGRWLSIHRLALFDIFELPPTSWCGLFLKRRALFAEHSSGDIDFIAGPLRELLDADGRAAPVWPPGLDRIVACEVKVSRYSHDAPVGMRLSPSYRNHRRRITGQLLARRRYGFSRIGFLHLAFVRPVSAAGHNPWMLNAAIAHEAIAEMMPLFTENDVPGCGYIVAAQGGVPHKEEHLAGGGGTPRMVRAPTNLLVGEESLAMRTKLSEVLIRCPKPASFTPTLRHCPTCGELRMIPGTARCACTEPDVEGFGPPSFP